MALDGSRWIDSSRRFFLPVKALSHIFRKKFCQQLCELFQQHRLQFHGSLQQLASPDAFSNLLSQLGQKDWVVYAKPPFGGTEQVLNYLARYTHRVAISNHLAWRPSTTIASPSAGETMPMAARTGS